VSRAVVLHATPASRPTIRWNRCAVSGQRRLQGTDGVRHRGGQIVAADGLEQTGASEERDDGLVGAGERQEDSRVVQVLDEASEEFSAGDIECPRRFDVDHDGTS
jgi:hypothetical protein